VFLAALVSASAAARASDILVASQAQLDAALSSVHAGDSIVLQNGVWSNLNVNKQNLAGAVGAPITIRAQTPGQVAITGPNYFFDVGGHDYVVTGLTFKDENSNLKSIRFRGTNSHVYDNAVLSAADTIRSSTTSPTARRPHQQLRPQLHVRQAGSRARCVLDLEPQRAHQQQLLRPPPHRRTERAGPTAGKPSVSATAVS
jgi:hypothetical protein